MNILNSLNWRYAVKKFNNDKVPQNDIDELIEAVRLTPSSYGLQPFKLIVVESDDIRSKLLQHSMGQGKVKESSHLFIFAYKNNFNESDINEYFQLFSQQRNISQEQLAGFQEHVKSAILGLPEQDKKNWAINQTYVALGNLLTVAALKQIDTCPMGGFVADGFDRVLGLSEKQLSCAVICAIGYRSTLDESSSYTKVRLSHEHFVEKV